MVHTDSTTPSDVRPQAPVGDTPGTSDRGQTPQPAHKYRFPTLIDLLALVGIWYLLQFVGLLAARLAGFDFPDWDLLRGNVAPTPEQQDALARFTAFTYLVTMGLMILFTLFYRRLRHGTRKTLRFSARGLNPVLLLWGLVMMLAAGIVIEPVVELLGTFDITTIRASIGMYLVCKAIHEMTDIRVLLTGEISDELFGYKYTDFAPSAKAFQEEAQKRIRELHMYDVLRADRCISVNSLEARVPFGDLDFVKYVMAIDPEMKLNKYGKGKYLLRHAFEKGDYLPHDILWREKAAFSDAVGHSMVDYLKEYAETVYTQEEFEEKRAKYTHAQPFTKESLLYREIFEKYYPGQSQMIVDFWMPNKSWEGCNVNDPSARVLANYGDSGK